MYKLFISITGAGFVLLTGLVSCSQEKKTTDVYRAKSPVVRYGSGSQDLKTWNLLAKKEFDLHDALDFSESAPSRITVTSDCQSANVHYYGQGTFAGVTEVKIWQTLPVEVLTAPLESEKFSCAFDLNLFNAAGSNHVFPVSPVSVVEHLRPEAHVARDGGQSPERLTPGQLQDIRLRYSNASAATAQIVCRDVELNTLPFQQSLDLAQFDFSNPRVRPKSPQTVLQNRPLQNCRALIRENGRATALSNLFALAFPPPRFAVREMAASISPATDDQSFVQRVTSIFNGQPVTLKSWGFLNAAGYKRLLRIPRAPATLDLTMVMRTTDLLKREARATGLTVVTNAAVVQTEPASILVAVEAGQNAIFSLVFRGTSPYRCSQDGISVQLLQFRNAPTLEVLEVDGQGNAVSAPYPLQASDLSLLMPSGVESPALARAAERCDWN